MALVLITDGKYRSTIAAARALGRAGYEVVVTQTRAESPLTPPVFESRFVSRGIYIEGSFRDLEYPERLMSLIKSLPSPVLLCGGAVTQNAVAERRDAFSPLAPNLLPRREVLDSLNDKEEVHERCVSLGIPAPREFTGEPDSYPVIIKPHCGEKFGLKAAQRYVRAKNREEYLRGLDAMGKYDAAPLVQEAVEGEARGASLLLDRESRLIGAICHRRIREYPALGGPSACCESVYDDELVETAYTLLRSFGFSGLAMVEFKGRKVLEVNPRLWGSFPLTEQSGSPIAVKYARAAAGERLEYDPRDYRAGVRMRFTLNNAAAAVDYLRHGRAGMALGCLGDMFSAREALSARDDPAPLRRYMRNNLLRR